MAVIDLPTTINTAPTALTRTAFRLQLDFGWTTQLHDDLLTVHLDDQLSAIELPTDVATELLAALRSRALDCPVVVLPGTPEKCVLFHRENGDPVRFPAEVTALPAGHTVPLPPSTVHGETAHWLSSPWKLDVSLPSTALLAELLTAAVTRSADRPTPRDPISATCTRRTATARR